MEDINSLEYLQSLKNESRDRYQEKPCKPLQAAEAMQERKQSSNLLPYDVLMGLYLEAAGRLNATGKRPLPYIPEAEDELNEAWRVCLLGWAGLEYFKKALEKWERLTGGCDSTLYKDSM